MTGHKEYEQSEHTAKTFKGIWLRLKKKKRTDFQNLPSNSDGAVSLSFKHFEKGYASCSSNSVVLFLWEIGIELDWISF